MTSRFIMSLDFELHWGVADHTPARHFHERAMFTRLEVIPTLLDTFERFDLSATWATVGALFCENREEMIELGRTIHTQYADPRFSFGMHAADVGETEIDDPLHFAPSIIRQIADTPGQEIGSHTFSHIYPLEKGVDRNALSADLLAAKTIANRRGIDVQSLVLPRNQYDDDVLQTCARAGFSSVRTNPDTWWMCSRAFTDESLAQRAFRLTESYVVPLRATHASRDLNLTQTTASVFFRPAVSSNLLNTLRLHQTKLAMTQAANAGLDFHLWWHPHNFATRFEETMTMLLELLRHYKYLSDQGQMNSSSMTALGSSS